MPVATVGVTCVLVLVSVCHEGNRQPKCLVKLDLFPTRSRAHERCRSGRARADATGSITPPTTSDAALVGDAHPLPAGADRARDRQTQPPGRPTEPTARGAPAPRRDTRARTAGRLSAAPRRRGCTSRRAHGVHVHAAVIPTASGSRLPPTKQLILNHSPQLEVSSRGTQFQFRCGDSDWSK